MERVQLGNTGIETTYLAIGTGTSGWNKESNQTRLGYRECVDLIRYAVERGIRFIDTADQYGSQPHVAEVVKAVGRENLVLATKTIARDRAAAERDLPRMFRELGTDHVDILLLHCMTSSDWPEERASAMDVLSEWKEKGRIRAVGVSCHHVDALERAAEEEWVDVVLARINFDGVNMDDHPDRVIPALERLHAAGKGVYGMKVLGQKKLADEWRHAIRFVFDLDCVDAVTIGMESRADVDRNVDYIESLFAGGAPSGASLPPDAERPTAPA